MSPHNLLLGIGMALMAVAFFAVLDTTTKFVGALAPILLVICVRYICQALITAVAIYPLRGRSLFQTAHPKFHLTRGFLLLGSSIFAILSLRYLPVGEFTSILMISPLMVTVFAAIILKEKVSPLRAMLVAGGFIGTIIIVRPSSSDFSWFMLLPLCLVGTTAWFQVLTSRMTRTEDPLAMQFISCSIAGIICLAMLPFVWAPIPHAAWVGMAIIVVASTSGHFALIFAFKNAPASTLTPYFYAQIPFALFGAWLVFDHVPDFFSMVGIGLVAVCGATGALLTVRESRVRAQPVET